MSKAFLARHLGADAVEQTKMLTALGVSSAAELLAQALPERLQVPSAYQADACSETEMIKELQKFASQNRVRIPMLGLGYARSILPSVIQRNVLENPAWYTAYTPYQAEISQGRLEALLNFQTLVSELTALPIANASLLDEATAAAEAMTLAYRQQKDDSRRAFWLDAACHPQVQAVLALRAEPLGISLILGTLETLDAETAQHVFAGLLPYPDTLGRVRDLKPAIGCLQAHGALAIVAADPLALMLLPAPGALGADIAIGSMQRFGLPLWYGGPHAAYMAVKDDLKRLLPGRLIGVSKDAAGHTAYRLALQTREQHIRRDKATSNICTAQVLLAVVNSFYALYHGQAGLLRIAEQIHAQACRLASALSAFGLPLLSEQFFDTVTFSHPRAAALVQHVAETANIQLRLVNAEQISIACDETTDAPTLAALLTAIGQFLQRTVPEINTDYASALKERRSEAALQHGKFYENYSETKMLRLLRRLADKDIALDRGMIPLGSCTMKLNPTTAMLPVSWPAFADMHPFAPLADAQGFQGLIDDLAARLAAITGFAAVSLQPNAGSQGEYAGLLVIRRYLQSLGQGQRHICLIPESAHGTNAASAVMAGMQVVTVKIAADGSVDVTDAEAKITQYAEHLAAMMITYPSTSGVYEAGIPALCERVHAVGGQVYLDGANFNALLMVTQPPVLGADVMHMNLHKTFAIPHGGGGPGVGPIAVKAHLAAFLPNHPLHPKAGPATGIGAVSAAPFGSAGILAISYSYLRMLGSAGLQQATQQAVVQANYLAARLQPYFPVLYRGQQDRVAHECIIDPRPYQKTTGVTAEDIAKRLMDYGFHAPTLSFPVAGTLMIEPTESEDLAEIERFCRAMISIHGEMEKIAQGIWPKADNPLKNAPHTAEELVGDWSHPYSREEAVYPLPEVRENKYWPPVKRVDNVLGDRQLFCACPPLQSLSATS
jgi:glycine dehydrogenase